MLALRPLIAIFSIVLIPLMATYLWLQPTLSTNVRTAIVALSAFAVLALLRRSVVQPLKILSVWKSYANEHGYAFSGSLSHEVFLKGTRGERPFVAGVSAHRADTGSGRYRTLVTAEIESALPAGLRVYSSEVDVWLNEYSDRNTVHTGDQAIEEGLRCEGAEPEEVRDFMEHPDRQALLLEFVITHPQMLLHGSYSAEMPAAPGASGVITVSVLGRIGDMTRLDSIVNEVCEFAQRIDDIAADLGS